MKKLIKIGVAVVILLVIAVVALTFMLGSIIKKGVETVGPQLTKTDLELADVKLSLLSGKGEIIGFDLGNPVGYKAPSAIRVSHASVILKPSSVLSDKIIIRSIQVDTPEIVLEGGFSNNNLTKILDNIEAASGGGKDEGTPSQDPKAPRPDSPPGQTKLQVDEFILRNAKLHYAIPGMGGQTVALTLPPIELKNLGQGEEGITVSELMERVLSAVINQSSQTAGSTASVLGQQATKLLQGLGGSDDTNGVSKSLKSLGDLLK